MTLYLKNRAAYAVKRDIALILPCFFLIPSLSFRNDNKATTVTILKSCICNQ